MTPSAALVVFVLTIAASAIGLWVRPQLIEWGLFRPFVVARGKDRHTWITSGFLHADLPHLLFNMVTFWFFAFQLERAIGAARFLALYLIALVLSNTRTFLKHRANPDYASLGASGAISAVLFASIVYFPTQQLFILPFPFPIPAPLFAVAYVAYSWWSGRAARGRINHDAHLDGALTGLVFVALTDPRAYSGLLRLLG
jgi:membrane associated rhomboid family serine protease